MGPGQDRTQDQGSAVRLASVARHVTDCAMHCNERPNKKINVFRVFRLKILGRAGTYIFFKLFIFSGKKYSFAFQNA